MKGETGQTQWVASTLHTSPEHGVSSITTADAQNSAASSGLNWTGPFRTKDEMWFLPRLAASVV